MPSLTELAGTATRSHTRTPTLTTTTMDRDRCPLLKWGQPKNFNSVLAECSKTHLRGAALIGVASAPRT